MKTPIVAAVALMAMVLNSLVALTDEGSVDGPVPARNTVDLAAPAPALQDAVPPAPQDPPAPPSEASPSDVPVPTELPRDAAPAIAPVPPVVMPPPAPCDACQCFDCGCPVPTRLCLVDPCDGCLYCVWVDLPPCCAGSSPQIDWKHGLLGRKVVWLCWPCCQKQVKVVVPLIGGLRVWE